MIEENVKNLIASIPEKNPFGEKITLVAAVKTQTPEDIDRAVAAGITDIGDNHVQELKERFNLLHGNPKIHFIGHLQTNKIKYILGKVDLYHSVDRLNLAEELSRRSEAAGITSRILIQINIGNEETKSGFRPEETEDAYAAIKKLPALETAGLMAMMPLNASDDTVMRLAAHMREKYDKLRAYDSGITCLSMGMSGDWKICVQAGSNMIRLGTAIFGKREYGRNESSR